MKFLVAIVFLVSLSACGEKSPESTLAAEGDLIHQECPLEGMMLRSYNLLCENGKWVRNYFSHEGEEAFVRALGSNRTIVCKKFLDSYNFYNKLTLTTNSDAVSDFVAETTFTGWEDRNDSYHEVDRAKNMIRKGGYYPITDHSSFELKGNPGFRLAVDLKRKSIIINACDRWKSTTDCHTHYTVFTFDQCQ